MVARDITIRHLTRMNLEATQRELENARDELERKVEHRTAALQESVQSLEQVLYHVAHDLRAPLRTMEGFSSILVQKFSPKVDPETERLTGMISDAAQRMDHLIQDLLVYGRLCNEPVRREKISTEVAVEAALIQLSNKLRQSSAQVQVLPPLPNVWGDYNVLLQVLIELISNAISFRALTRTLHLRLRASPVKRCVRLWVEDNGIGIPLEHQDRIFWMFERLSHDNSSGTGMGLAIARKGIERMEGKIGVESEPGAGSRFWFELPATDETVL